jgi:hypothetical protein
MGTNLVLIAYGRHDDRGKLFPRTKRQIDNLKEPLQRLVGDFTSDDYRVYHDGTDPAQETAAQIGFSCGTEECKCEFLGCVSREPPDKDNLTKAFRLVEQAEQKNVVFVGDPAYVSHFARFYMTQLQKKQPAPEVTRGGAVVFRADGTLHSVLPLD